MTINRWSNRLDDLLSNAFSPTKLSNFLLVLIGQFDNFFISESLQVVCFNDGLKDREAMLDVAKVIEPVNIDSSDLNLVTRSRCIHQVMKDKTLFLARDSTWRNSAWCLLNGEFLVVPIDGVDFIDSEGAFSLADHTGT